MVQRKGNDLKIKYSKIDGSIHEFIDPHHIQSRKLGRRDDIVINICQHHHVTGGINDAIHQAGVKSWQKNINIDVKEHARMLRKNYEA